MEKAWIARWLDSKGKLSLWDSNCKTNPEFDFCVIQAFVIIYPSVWGCLCLPVLCMFTKSVDVCGV